MEEAWTEKKPERIEIDAAGMKLASTEKNLVYFMVKEGEKALIIRLQRQNCEDVCYKISPSMAMRYLMVDYCDRMGLVDGLVRFVYDGVRLNKDKTAAELQMEDDDVIDVFSEGWKIGG